MPVRRAAASSMSVLRAAWIVVMATALAACGESAPSDATSSRLDGATAPRNALGYPNYDEAYDVAVQSDHKVVVAGASDQGSEPPDFADIRFALARYTAAGRLDRSFGLGGKVAQSFFGPATTLAIQSDGRIVAAAIAGDDRDRRRGSGSRGTRPPVASTRVLARAAACAPLWKAAATPSRRR